MEIVQTDRVILAIKHSTGIKWASAIMDVIASDSRTLHV